MSRWMLSTAIAAVFGVMAVAEDRPSAKPAKVIRVLVLEDAQPSPAGPSSAPVVVPGIVVDGSASIAVTNNCAADDNSKKRSSKWHHPFKREDCEGCGSLRYYLWFDFSSCRSFFNEGPYAPRYPDKCPNCCPHH
jgi:hypothetical protein